MRLRNKKWTDQYLIDHADWLLQPQPDQKFNLQEVFPNGYEKYELEIGCGKGQFIIQKALKNPQINFIGMEKEQTVVGVATRKAVGVAEQYQVKKLPNLYFLNFYAEKLAEYFQPKTFQKIYLNFSDPWPKTKHASKRLTHHDFLAEFSYLLTDQGEIEIKTDNDGLYAFTLEELEGNEFFEISYQTTDLYADNVALENNIATEYETKFHQAGKPIKKIILRKKNIV